MSLVDSAFAYYNTAKNTIYSKNRNVAALAEVHFKPVRELLEKFQHHYSANSNIKINFPQNSGSIIRIDLTGGSNNYHVKLSCLQSSMSPPYDFIHNIEVVNQHNVDLFAKQYNEHDVDVLLKRVSLIFAQYEVEGDLTL